MIQKGREKKVKVRERGYKPPGRWGDNRRRRGLLAFADGYPK
jgi:hypothetical protein